MWYSQGTISATSNNTIINGTGTAFIQGVRVGDGITIQGSSSLHEVISIASNTQMTIKPAYTGATGSGKQYAVAPVLGYDKDLSDAFNQLRLQFGDKLSSLQPWAYAATASAALDALGFSASGKTVATGTAAQGRVGLGLKTASTRDVGVSRGNVMEVGAFGIGSSGNPTVLMNINDLNSSCIFRYNNSSVGFPIGFGEGLYLHGTDQSSGYANILLTDYSASKYYIMRKSAGAWFTDELTHTGNILTTTGQSNLFPMTQKAVTVAINGVSDRRDKLDITPNGVGLELIEKLEPVSFRLNKRDWYRKQAATSIETHTDEDGTQTEAEKINLDVIAKPLTDYDDNDGTLARNDMYTGLIAQDVKAALEGLGLGDLAIIKNYSDEYEGGDDRHYIEYNGLIPVMINAIKELSSRVKELEIKVEHEELDDETITRDQE